MRHLADQYLADKVATATPAQLTGMLFDAAVGALRGAIRLQESGDWMAALPRSLKAQRIVLELREALDHEAGGELAGNLWQLYTWVHGCLVRANSERDVVATRDALAVLEPLAGAWREGVLGAAPVPA